MQAVHIVQKNLINIKLPLISALVLLSISFSATAINCQSSLPSVGNRTSTISVSSYTGNDLPVGATIYTNLVLTPEMGVHCDAAFNVPLHFSVTVMPYGPPSIISGVQYGSAPVFPTNVSGVGVAFIMQRKYFSATDIHSFNNFLTTNNTTNGISWGISSGGVYITMVLIKTGPIASGSVVQGNSFPTVSLSVPATQGYTGLPLNLSTVNWAGTVNFTTSTCTVPDVNVNMNTWDISKISTTIGSTSTWVNSSIVLQNCPTFSGRFSSTYQLTSLSGVASGTVRDRNLITVSLTPNTTILDATNGVFAVNTAGSTGQAATGVGIQLGYSTDINASPTLPTTIWKSGTTWNITPPNDGRSSFKIPLAARYYKTSKSVTPGPANASVTFNIDYK